MSNLGGYQKIIEVVKAFGGPKRATAIVGSAVAVVGYGALRGVEAGAKKGVAASRAALKKRKTPCPVKGQLFEVTSDGESDRLTLHVGDEFRVLGSDQDAIIVELLGARENPHVVSIAFLASVSGFPTGRHDVGD